MMRVSGLLPVLVFLFVIAMKWTCSALGQPIHPEEREKDAFDCGTLALYHLLRIEGQPVGLAAIGLHLPTMPPLGYSMLELREAAKASGLRLSGIRLKDPAREVDRPMIAFLKRGHYVVLRPIGHTGKLIQVFNGAEPTRVIDKERLFASSEWTGLVLVPSRSIFEVWVTVLLACLSGLVFVFLMRIGRRPLSSSGGLGTTGSEEVASDPTG